MDAAMLNLVLQAGVDASCQHHCRSFAASTGNDFRDYAVFHTNDGRCTKVTRLVLRALAQLRVL
jgi:hypothetical protein